MRILLQLLALYLGGMPACGQTLGATHLLSRGPGAEAAALGNSVVAIARDPSALYWNPAGLANAGGMLTGEHLFVYDGARYNFTGLSVPSGLGTFGLGALQFSRGNVVGRSAIDDPGMRVDDTQTGFLVGFARRIGKHFAAGGTADILHFNLAGNRAMAVGLDLGGQASLPSGDLGTFRQPLWSLGAVLKNLLEPRIDLANEKETLPRELRGGLSLSFRTFSRTSMASGVIRHDRAAASVSFKKVAGEPGLHPGLGLSYDYEDMLVLRLGYDSGLAGGVGLRMREGRFSVDYALENRRLSKNHRFTLSFRFLSPPPHPEGSATDVDEDYGRALARAKSLSEEHFLRGQNHFKSAEYHKALDPLRLAALLDPDDSAKTALYRRALDVAWREKLRRLSQETDEALAKDDNLSAYRATARMLALGPADRDRLAAILLRLKARLRPSELGPAAAEVFEERQATAFNFASAGLMSDAFRIVDGLELSQSSGTAAAVEALKDKVAAEGRALRSRLAAQASEASSAGDHGKAYRALSALQRAYPEDPGIVRQADFARSRAASAVSLDIKERLYLRRLYLLAAVQYANGNVDGARDMIEEVLRRDPTDGPACAMETAMAGAILKEDEVQ